MTVPGLNGTTGERAYSRQCDRRAGVQRRTLPADSVTLRPAVPHRETEAGLSKREIHPFVGVIRTLIRHAGSALAIGVLLGSTGAAAALHGPEVERGARMFRFCAGCHSLKAGEIRLGPPLAGLIGRRAGAVAGYSYSNALRRSGVLWYAVTLDAWLANPSRFVPGTRMRFSGIRNDRARAALISFLESATR